MLGKNNYTAGDNMMCCRTMSVGCGYFEELFWTGGGIGRHISHTGNGGSEKA